MLPPARVRKPVARFLEVSPVPANLTPQYLEAEQRFKQATTSADKIKALRHMMAVIPMHKGTEKIRAELRRKLSRLQDEVESERHRKSGSRGSPGHVPHEGAGQVALVGPANAGKSSSLAALTAAHPKIAPYPFTTIEPQAGMMPFEDVHVQLVDTPAVSAEFMEPWFPELVRRADRVLLVADLGSDTLHCCCNLDGAAIFPPAVPPIPDAIAEPRSTAAVPEGVSLASIASSDIAAGGILREANIHTNMPERARQETTTYTVQSGDTVSGIADRFGLQAKTVLAANYDVLQDDPHMLRPGQELRILPIDGVYWEWLGGIPFSQWAIL